MWIFLMLILSITAGTALTLEQRSDSLSQMRTDPQSSLNHLPLTMTLHSSTDQQTNMLVLIIFSCMKRNKVICKMCDLNVLFFSPKTQPFRQIQNETKRLHPQILPESPVAPPEYLLHIWAKSHLHVHIQKQGPHWCSQQWHLPLFGYVDALSLREKAWKKTRRWLVVSGTLLLAENLKWNENQKWRFLYLMG